MASAETSTDNSAPPPAETALPLEALRDWMMNDGRLPEFLEANPGTSREQTSAGIVPSDSETAR